MKKGLGVLLTAILVAVFLFVLPVATNAVSPYIVYNGTCGDSIEWSFDTATGVLTLSGSGAMYDYVQAASGRNPFYNHRNSITSIVVGEGITYIGNYGFYYLIKATSLQLPSTVTVLGSNAFLNCRLVDGVVLPSAVTTIGEAAFKGCSALSSIVIPSGVTNIGDFAFYNTELSTVEIPASVTQIGASAFYGTPLEALTLNEGLISIGASAFSQTLLTSVAIPASVTTLSYESFRFSNLLTEYIVHENNLNYTSHNGILYSKDYSRLISCPAGIT